MSVANIKDKVNQTQPGWEIRKTMKEKDDNEPGRSQVMTVNTSEYDLFKRLEQGWTKNKHELNKRSEKMKTFETETDSSLENIERELSMFEENNQHFRRAIENTSTRLTGLMTQFEGASSESTMLAEQFKTVDFTVTELNRRKQRVDEELKAQNKSVDEKEEYFVNLLKTLNGELEHSLKLQHEICVKDGNLASAFEELAVAYTQFEINESEILKKYGLHSLIISNSTRQEKKPTTNFQKLLSSQEQLKSFKLEYQDESKKEISKNMPRSIPRTDVSLSTGFARKNDSKTLSEDETNESTINNEGFCRALNDLNAPKTSTPDIRNPSENDSHLKKPNTASERNYNNKSMDENLKKANFLKAELSIRLQTIKALKVKVEKLALENKDMKCAIKNAKFEERKMLSKYDLLLKEINVKDSINERYKYLLCRENDKRKSKDLTEKARDHKTTVMLVKNVKILKTYSESLCKELEKSKKQNAIFQEQIKNNNFDMEALRHTKRALLARVQQKQGVDDESASSHNSVTLTLENSETVSNIEAQNHNTCKNVQNVMTTADLVAINKTSNESKTLDNDVKNLRKTTDSDLSIGPSLGVSVKNALDDFPKQTNNETNATEIDIEMTSVIDSFYLSKTHRKEDKSENLTQNSQVISPNNSQASLNLTSGSQSNNFSEKPKHQDSATQTKDDFCQTDNAENLRTKDIEMLKRKDSDLSCENHEINEIRKLGSEHSIISNEDEMLQTSMTCLRDVTINIETVGEALKTTEILIRRKFSTQHLDGKLSEGEKMDEMFVPRITFSEEVEDLREREESHEERVRRRVKNREEISKNNRLNLSSFRNDGFSEVSDMENNPDEVFTDEYVHKLKVKLKLAREKIRAKNKVIRAQNDDIDVLIDDVRNKQDEIEELNVLLKKYEERSEKEGILEVETPSFIDSTKEDTCDGVVIKEQILAQILSDLFTVAEDCCRQMEELRNNAAMEQLEKEKFTEVEKQVNLFKSKLEEASIDHFPVNDDEQEDTEVNGSKEDLDKDNRMVNGVTVEKEEQDVFVKEDNDTTKPITYLRRFSLDMRNQLLSSQEGISRLNDDPKGRVESIKEVGAACESEACALERMLQQKEIDRLEEEMKGVIGNFETDIAILVKSFTEDSKTSEEVKELEMKLKTSQMQVEKDWQIIEQQAADIDELKQQVENQRIAIEIHEENLRDASNTISEDRKTIEELTDILENNGDSQLLLEQSVEELGTLLSEKENKIAELEKLASERIAEMEPLLNEKEDKIAELGTLVSEKEDNIAELENSLVECESLLRDKEAGIAKLEKMIAELEGSLRDTEVDIERLLKENSEEKEREARILLDKSKNELAILKSESEKLRSDLAESNKAMDEKDSKIQSLESEKDILIRQNVQNVQKLSEEISEFQDQIKQLGDGKEASADKITDSSIQQNGVSSIDNTKILNKSSVVDLKTKVHKLSNLLKSIERDVAYYRDASRHSYEGLKYTLKLIMHYLPSSQIDKDAYEMIVFELTNKLKQCKALSTEKQLFSLQASTANYENKKTLREIRRENNDLTLANKELKKCVAKLEKTIQSIEHVHQLKIDTIIDSLAKRTNIVPKRVEGMKSAVSTEDILKECLDTVVTPVVQRSNGDDDSVSIKYHTGV